MSRERRFVAALLTAAVASLVPAGAGRAADPVDRLTAFAVDMSNLSTGGRNTATVDIIIYRWSTDAERDRLTDALREKGADGLLRALQKMDDVGRISRVGSLGLPLRFAREVPLSTGGRRILLGTDRQISFLEMREQPRTVDYPFVILDIRLNAEGKGEGKLMPLAKITQDRDHVVEIENYASEPVRLTSVVSKIEKRK